MHHNDDVVLADTPLQMAAGPRPIAQILSADEILAAQSSANCDANGWKQSLSVYHNMVGMVYILTLPRQTVYNAAIASAKRLLAMGFPPDKVTVFVGIDCKALWGNALVQTGFEWFGHLPQWNATGVEKGWPLWSKEKFAIGPHRPELTTSYSTCDVTDPVASSKGCFSSCCAMSHQAIMVDAYHRNGFSPETRVMVLEDDATPAPAMFHQKTIDIMTKLSARTDWSMIKLGECETFTDDERVVVYPQEQCAAAPTDAKHSIPYQFLTSVLPGKLPLVAGDLQVVDDLDREDIRTHRSYCSHAYMLNGRVANGIVETHFPAKTNCDNQMTETCEIKGEACLRLEKNIFNQNHSQDSTLPTSCHPCAADKDETLDQPRPLTFSVNAEGLGNRLTNNSFYSTFAATCTQRGLALCPARAYCNEIGLVSASANHSDSRTRMIDTWFALQNDHWSRFKTTFENWVRPAKIWMPVAGGHDTWVHLQSCSVLDVKRDWESQHAGTSPPYVESLTGKFEVGCCVASENGAAEAFRETSEARAGRKSHDSSASLQASRL